MHLYIIQTFIFQVPEIQYSIKCAKKNITTHFLHYNFCILMVTLSQIFTFFLNKKTLIIYPIPVYIFTELYCNAVKLINNERNLAGKAF